MARPASTAFDKEIRSQVAANLNTLLRRKGWTKADLAKQSQISPSTLSGYFNQKYNITPGNLQKISDIFEVEKGDIDPRYKIDGDFTETIQELIDAFDNHSASNNVLAFLRKSKPTKKALKYADTSPFQSPNALANRKANMSKPDSDLNPEEQLDKFTLQAEANTAYILLEKYIKTANQLLSIRDRIKPSEELQHFLTVIAGTITVADDIKREYSEILIKAKQEEK